LKNARRIFAIVSTTSIPTSASKNHGNQCGSSVPGSRLEADHPEKGVLFACRFTGMPMFEVGGGAWRGESEAWRPVTCPATSARGAASAACSVACTIFEQGMLEGSCARDAYAEVQGACPPAEGASPRAAGPDHPALPRTQGEPTVRHLVNMVLLLLTLAGAIALGAAVNVGSRVLMEAPPPGHLAR
jgi:hypothetical protein